MKPLELLQEKLRSVQHDLEKAKEAFDRKDIPENTYNMYVENITPNIQDYKDAIHCLKIFGK
jgi:predicted transcriptional regulator YdeE